MESDYLFFHIQWTFIQLKSKLYALINHFCLFNLNGFIERKFSYPTRESSSFISLSLTHSLILVLYWYLLSLLNSPTVFHLNLISGHVFIDEWRHTLLLFSSVKTLLICSNTWTPIATPTHTNPNEKFVFKMFSRI